MAPKWCHVLSHARDRVSQILISYFTFNFPLKVEVSVMPEHFKAVCSADNREPVTKFLTTPSAKLFAELQSAEARSKPSIVVFEPINENQTKYNTTKYQSI